MRPHATFPRTLALALSGLTLLAACDTAAPTLKPQARPAELDQPATQPDEPTRSTRSQTLSRYYARVQSELLTQGLMRADGGGADTPFDADDLARNFEIIAFFDEHARGSLAPAKDRPGKLHRWEGPVRMKADFAPSVPEEIRDRDNAVITRYAARLGQVTDHPIGVTRSSSANFHVLVGSVDDQDYILRRVREIAPDISDSALDIFRNLPRSIHCFVLAFPGSDNSDVYQLGIAYVRAEHPDFLRRACYHEELAQGLGLANDSARARPSIFNDDDEFALLTRHDELLLKMLYDRRLKPGMRLEKARPIFRQIAAELLPDTS
ncbi:DUF2927 domain-containing protein [Aquicoccus sp.]|uniref:DUF2927 domain-containing protein n=1 Tax=Aquicoccus sp. TaxID=2055851 RepID=UPI003561C37A